MPCTSEMLGNLPYPPLSFALKKIKSLRETNEALCEIRLLQLLFVMKVVTEKCISSMALQIHYRIKSFENNLTDDLFAI